MKCLLSPWAHEPLLGLSVSLVSLIKISCGCGCDWWVWVSHLAIEFLWMNGVVSPSPSPLHLPLPLVLPPLLARYWYRYRYQQTNFCLLPCLLAPCCLPQSDSDRVSAAAHWYADASRLRRCRRRHLPLSLPRSQGFSSFHIIYVTYVCLLIYLLLRLLMNLLFFRGTLCRVRDVLEMVDSFSFSLTTPPLYTWTKSDWLNFSTKMQVFPQQLMSKTLFLKCRWY